MSEKRYSHDFYTLRPKPRGCKSTASPSTRRFGSARPHQNAYGLLKSFNSLNFLSWRMQHDYNANPTLRQHKQLIYIAIGLRFLLAAWHRWGLARAGPAATRINLKQTCFPSQGASHILTSDVTCGRPYHLAWGFLQLRNVPKSTAKHCPFTARTGLQHHRGVNCRDLHGAANVGILEGHGTRSQSERTTQTDS